MTKDFKRILLANRSDCAVRIIRACKEMGIETVTIYSVEEKGAFHTRIADHSICIGETAYSESYLNAYKILSIASKYNVDAIHPGIGFLAENSDFAQLCEKMNICFIGPGSNIIDMMGNKITAKNVARECNVPILSDICIEELENEDILLRVKKNDYPVIIKATQGGGGKGIRIANTEDELVDSISICKRESEQSFGEGSIYVEKYITDAKHIEVQIMADKFGNVIHLGDRECSIQLHYQKLIEEARSSNISEELREKLYMDATTICKKIGYVGVGTVEFLVMGDEYYFMEMNTRLQVEHTITELITGIDIVKEQIRIAQGETLQYKQNDIHINGVALQCRITSQPELIKNHGRFGYITKYNMPGGYGVRVDSGYENNMKIDYLYDPLLCKICCYGSNKSEVVHRMIRCLNEMQIEGVGTNRDLLLNILNDTSFLRGDYSTNYVEKNMILS